MKDVCPFFLRLLSVSVSLAVSVFLYSVADYHSTLMGVVVVGVVVVDGITREPLELSS